MVDIISTNCNKFWKNENGKFHRTDNLPAVENEDGSKYWYVDGLFHRPSGLHTIESANGDKYWHVNGKLHCLNGPAFISTNGMKRWYINGKLHRLGGLPAVEDSDGHKAWYEYGNHHRLGGLPAIIWPSGYSNWFIYDEQYSFEKVCNINKILATFCRHCLKKIRLKRLRKFRNIHNELLCMPPNHKLRFSGGQDYKKVMSYFMSI